MKALVPRASVLSQLASCALAFAACSAPAPQPQDSVSPPAAAQTELPFSEVVDPTADWAAETIALPPGFAPELPSGTETLRFAPGWRDPQAQDYWSYAFVMHIDDPAPDEETLAALFDAYYDGLLYAVAPDVGEDAAQVEITRAAEGRYEARMQLIDSFTTLKPIEVLARIEVQSLAANRTKVRVQASRQPFGHPIWASLEAAIEAIEAE